MDNSVNQKDALINSEIEVSDMAQDSNEQTVKVPGAPNFFDVEGRPTFVGEQPVESSPTVEEPVAALEPTLEEKTEEEKLNDVMNEILASEDKEAKAFEYFNSGKLTSEQIDVLSESQVINKEKYNELLSQNNSSDQNLAVLFNTVKVPGAPTFFDVEGRPTFDGEQSAETAPTVEEPVAALEPEVTETPALEPTLEEKEEVVESPVMEEPVVVEEQPAETAPTVEEPVAALEPEVTEAPALEPTLEEKEEVVESPVMEEPVVVEENKDWNELINSVKERMLEEQAAETAPTVEEPVAALEPTLEGKEEVVESPVMEEPVFGEFDSNLLNNQVTENKTEESTETLDTKFTQETPTDISEKTNYEKPSVEEMHTEKEVPSSGFEYPSVADFYKEIREENAKSFADLREKTNKQLEEMKNGLIKSDVKSIDGTPSFLDVEGRPTFVGEMKNFDVNPVKETEFSEITNDELDKVISNQETDNNDSNENLNSNEQLKININTLKEEIEKNPLKGKIVVNDVRSYMVDNVEKDLAFIREYKKKVFIPAEVKEMISLYNGEIEKLTDKKTKLEEYSSDFRKQDLQQEKSEINAKINECRANSYKILKDVNLTNEEKQTKYKEIRDNQDKYQSRLAEIEKEIKDNVYTPDNTVEINNLSKTIEEYEDNVSKLKQVWSKHDPETEEFLNSMNNILNKKHDALEKLAVFDFDLKEEADKALTYFDNQEYENAQNTYNMVKDKQDKIKNVHSIMEEEILVLEGRKAYLESQLSDEKNYEYTKPEWMSIQSEKLESLRNLNERELNKINAWIDFLYEENKKYSFDGVKYLSVYDNPNFDFIHNFVVLPETAEMIGYRLDDLVKSKGITPIYEIDAKLEEEGLSEKEIEQNPEHQNHPESILQNNLYYDEEGILHGLETPLVKDTMEKNNLSVNDVYKYMDLYTHQQGKLELEENPEDIKKLITKKDYKYLDTINLYDEFGKERTSFPELRKIAFESYVPLEVLLDVIRKKDKELIGGLVVKEKSLPAKIWNLIKRNWKKIVVGAAGVAVVAGLLLGLTKCHDKDIDEDEVKDALDTPNKPKVEEETETQVEDVNDALSDYGVYVDNGYTGENNSSSHAKSNNNSANEEEQKEKTPEEKTPNTPEHDEDEVKDDRPYLEEGSHWGFSDGQIYYDGTVTFTNNGVRKTAKLPHGSYYYEEGKMYFDKELFELITKYDSINAVYSDGNGMLKLEDVRDYAETNKDEKDEEQTTPEKVVTPETPEQETADNNPTEEQTTPEEETPEVSPEDEKEAPGEYDPELKDVDEALEDGDITEEEKTDAENSVVDELNESVEDMLNNIETDIPEDEAYDTKTTFSSDLQKIKEIRELIANNSSEQNVERSMTR